MEQVKAVEQPEVMEHDHKPKVYKKKHCCEDQPKPNPEEHEDKKCCAENAKLKKTIRELEQQIADLMQFIGG